METQDEKQFVTAVLTWLVQASPENLRRVKAACEQELVQRAKDNAKPAIVVPVYPYAEGKLDKPSFRIITAWEEVGHPTGPDWATMIHQPMGGTIHMAADAGDIVQVYQNPLGNFPRREYYYVITPDLKPYYLGPHRVPVFQLFRQNLNKETRIAAAQADHNIQSIRLSAMDLRGAL